RAQRAACSFADGGQDTLALCSLLSTSHHQPEPILNEGSERASLCSGLAFGAVKQTLGKPDSGSLVHMSRHIRMSPICQRVCALRVVPCLRSAGVFGIALVGRDHENGIMQAPKRSMRFDRRARYPIACTSV